VAGHAEDKEFLSLYRVAGGVRRGAGYEYDSQRNYCTDKIFHRRLPQSFSFDSNYGVHATELSAMVQAGARCAPTVAAAAVCCASKRREQRIGLF
jgi:hypothetical protein